MIQLRFTRRPDFFDEYGQPCFNVNQDKGLSERQNNDLLNSALADGYTAKVAEALKNRIKSEVTSASPGTKVRSA
jgi:hypothetical protein